MFKKNRGRLSVRERISAFNATARFYAGAADKDPTPHLIAELPPKRERVRRPVDGKPAVPLERDILTQVMRALRSDPRVGFVWRQSSGTFQEGERYIQAGPKGMPDVLGILTGGRFFAIEVKRPGRKPEPHQEARLEHFRKCGAIAGHCWSAESALALLP